MSVDINKYLRLVTPCLDMPSSKSKSERVLALVKKAGVLRPRDLNTRAIPREHLRRLHAEGLLERPGRGLYVLTNSRPTEHHTLAEAAKRVPRGVVCLLSALRFHGIGTKAPFEVWLAISTKARLPKIDHPPIRFVRFSGDALDANIEEHTIESVRIRVYDPAKTVADCFKYRNKIGLDVALEALRDCRKQRKATINELWKAAGICRVANVMRPYLESIA
jgi:predicted transcriptional regulator of viral defense system